MFNIEEAFKICSQSETPGEYMFYNYDTRNLYGVMSSGKLYSLKHIDTKTLNEKPPATNPKLYNTLSVKEQPCFLPMNYEWVMVGDENIQTKKSIRVKCGETLSIKPGEVIGFGKLKIIRKNGPALHFNSSIEWTRELSKLSSKFPLYPMRGVNVEITRDLFNTPKSNFSHFSFHDDFEVVLEYFTPEYSRLSGLEGKCMVIKEENLYYELNDKVDDKNFILYQWNPDKYDDDTGYFEVIYDPMNVNQMKPNMYTRVRKEQWIKPHMNIYSYKDDTRLVSGEECQEDEYQSLWNDIISETSYTLPLDEREGTCHMDGEYSYLSQENSQEEQSSETSTSDSEYQPEEDEEEDDEDGWGKTSIASWESLYEETRLDEFSGGFYTKQEFYDYYGCNDIWEMMHPKNVYIRSMVALNAHRYYWWPTENFKTYLQMIEDGY